VGGSSTPTIVANVGELDGWKYCPRCRAELESPDTGKLECPSCGLTIYAGSKPTASALVVDGENRVLLGRRARDPDKGKWDLPGGFLDEGEHPLDALKRELAEETSLEIEPGELFDIVIDRYGEGDDAPATLNLYWTARVLSGQPEPDDDVAELRWFEPDELPPAERLAFRNNHQVLSAWRQKQT
jgi:8-oxo-dGTP diphosphatase